MAQFNHTTRLRGIKRAEVGCAESRHAETQRAEMNARDLGSPECHRRIDRQIDRHVRSAETITAEYSACIYAVCLLAVCYSAVKLLLMHELRQSVTGAVLFLQFWQLAGAKLIFSMRNRFSPFSETGQGCPKQTT